MKIHQSAALDRLTGHDHGILSTLHPTRGVDSVPVVYAVVDGFAGVPVDLVKPKSSTRLTRQQNLEADPRAALLIEHWDRVDWSQLWWVRAELEYEAAPERDLVAALATQLAESFEQYRDQPFADMIVLRITAVSGWSASDT